MLTLLTPLHAIAVRRGDGLRSELAGSLTRGANPFCTASGESKMSREQDNKAVVGRWFEGFWGNPWNPQIIDELAAPDMLLQYSLHAPRRGRRGRLWSVDGKVAAPTPDRLSAIFSLVRCRRHRVENALHWYDRIACREQQDRGGNRARRRGHRADAAWYLESRLTVRGDWIGHEPDPVSASAEAETFGAQSCA